MNGCIFIIGPIVLVQLEAIVRVLNRVLPIVDIVVCRIRVEDLVQIRRLGHSSNRLTFVVSCGGLLLPKVDNLTHSDIATPSRDWSIDNIVVRWGKRLLATVPLLNECVHILVCLRW